MRRVSAVWPLAVLAVAAGCAPKLRAHQDGDWAATWAAAPQPVREGATVLTDQTVRQTTRISLGGRKWRLRFSNVFGAGEARIDDVHLALASAGAAIQPGSDRRATFGGKAELRLAPGETRFSDPIDLPAPALSRLAVSLHATSKGGATEHALGLDAGFVAAGDHAADADLQGATPLNKRLYLTEIDVAAPARARTAAVLGDSLTDGDASTPLADHRWTDRLAERLTGRQTPIAVANAGVAGNRLLHDLVGVRALARLDRDALDLTGVSDLIVLEGLNDINLPAYLGAPEQKVTAGDIEDAYVQIVHRAHARGIRVIGATLTPVAASTTWPNYYSPAGEAERLAVNQWIRTSHVFDAVIDFDAILRDPKDPSHTRPDFDSGDHLHPNDAGYAAMAAAVDPSLLR